MSLTDDETTDVAVESDQVSEAETPDADGEEGSETAYQMSLDVDITDAGPCRKHVKVSVPRVDLDHYFGEAIGGLVDSANVPGFRPGHAPRKLIERRFRKELTDEVKRNVLLQSLEQLEEDKKLAPINQPDIDIEALDIPEDGPFEYDFEVEVRPEFDLPDYAGLMIERPVREVTDEDITRYQQRFLKQFRSYEDREGPAEIGDELTLNVEFFHNDSSLRKIKGVAFELLPVLRFEDAEVSNFGELLTGAVAGDRRESETVVSQETESLELRGETVRVEFEVVKVQKPIEPELNSTFLSTIGVESTEEMQTQIRETLERQVTYQQRQAVRTQVLEKITDSADWDLPEDLVRKQVENATRREILEMQQAGFTRQQILGRENELRQNAVSTTRQALKEHFVLDRIATDENIEVSQHELDMEIQIMAMQQGESARKLRQRMIRSQMMENLEAQIRERKAVDFVIEKAKFEDTPTEMLEDHEDDVISVRHSVAGGMTTTYDSGVDDEDDGE